MKIQEFDIFAFNFLVGKDLDYSTIKVLPKLLREIRQDAQAVGAGVDHEVHAAQLAGQGVGACNSAEASDACKALGGLCASTVSGYPVVVALGTLYCLAWWMAMKGRAPTEERAALPGDIEVFHVEPLTVPGLQAERCLVWMRLRQAAANPVPTA